MFVFCFQELLVILCLIIVVIPLPPKIRIMTAAAVTVPLLKEPGGTGTVIHPERCLSSRATFVIRWWCQLVSLERIQVLRQESWDENQTSEVLRTLHTEVPCSLASQRKQVFEKEMFRKGLAIKISEKWIWSSIIYCCYLLLFIFHFVLLSLVRLPFFRSPSFVPLSCSFRAKNYVKDHKQ